jgi:transcriptional regulator of aromatic amino acid metabolism
VEFQSKVFAGATQPLGSRDHFSQLPDDWRLARAAHEDLRRMGMPRVNLLFVGVAGMTRNVVGMLLRDREEPTVSWSPGERLLLPPVARGGTVILHEVGALSPQDQLRLLDWLEHAVSRAQVISTTSASLLPQVKSGAFVETLFYRLNTVCLDLTA